jgi:hypothetical protein
MPLSNATARTVAEIGQMTGYWRQSVRIPPKQRPDPPGTGPGGLQIKLSTAN